MLEGEAHDVIFSGDAAKNRAELLSLTADMTYDPADQPPLDGGNLDALWRRRPGTILIPGHDVPMVLQDAGSPSYLGPREAAIQAWFGEGLDQLTLYQLTG